MGKIGIIFFTFLIVIYLIIYFYLIYKRNSLSNIEKDNNSFFDEFCGGHFDSLGILDIFHNNILSTRVSLYSEFIVISYRKTIVLNYNEIENTVISGTIEQNPYKPSRDWKRLSIVHNKAGISKRIDLYLNNCEKVKLMIDERVGAKNLANAKIMRNSSSNGN